ncbi:MAG: hypothetical protein II209_01935, partial [Alistipes sp.]|nr:hypothetical protein [Alistipes sp.]
MSATKCKSVVSAIIENRYGIIRRVDIESSEDSLERTRERQSYIDSILEQYDRNLKVVAATYDERIKNAPPPSDGGALFGGGQWQRKPKREVPIVNHDASVYNALRTQMSNGQGLNSESLDFASSKLDYLSNDDGKVSSGLMMFNVSEPEVLFGNIID